MSLWGKQVSGANDKIKVLKRKFESWKILSTTMSLTASRYLKTFLMKLVLGGDINKCDLVPAFGRPA